MADYGTTEYYLEEIDKEQIEKEILLNALENICKNNMKDLHLIDIVVGKISSINTTIKWDKDRLEELIRKKEQGEVDDN